jgi:hypothetical protein
MLDKGSSGIVPVYSARNTRAPRFHTIIPMPAIVYEQFTSKISVESLGNLLSERRQTAPDAEPLGSHGRNLARMTCGAYVDTRKGQAA